ncbi:DUF4190 domain-containing protein [Parenemella sanctibonifatiensis]|uniref:DUF4190 domain-containing protein n=1 Tax=Parenemella sanctibonifatiensis TaxID=2016505 RepID=A0A255EL10_9ACTN|nr:DUF4190 domain-containing protein [Parenemella sanctibonifatiensis]OYN87915.1 hypothetical protein CGZ92_06560 [Parenemella sanctibonifatiensis]OYN92219.1 hypothetical protein CGZ91_01535 [Parenemella sanctibonifatiensis]
MSQPTDPYQANGNEQDFGPYSADSAADFYGNPTSADYYGPYSAASASYPDHLHSASAPPPRQQLQPNPYLHQASPYSSPAYRPDPRRSASNYGTPALVLGILSMVMMPLLGPFALGLGIAGVRSNPGGENGTSIAGIVMGALSTLGMIAFVMLMVVALGVS